MASIKIITTIDCQVALPDNAHNLGQEIEERLYTAISSMIPNLRYSRFIQSGTIKFALELQGRRVTMRRQGGVAMPDTGNKGDLNLDLESKSKKK